jgi:poly-gamma-glutamate capsule biosynthesis protein CapA/YwtB (metallophosphatase superfamily)
MGRAAWIGVLVGGVLAASGAPGCRAAAGTDEVAGLVFVGDIMLAEAPGELIANGIDPFEPFAKILGAHDLRIGNLECVIAESGIAEVKPYTFRAHPRAIPVLARHFDGVSVANNHSGDFGKAAFAEQLALLRSAKLPYFGGGDNSTEAHRPWIAERNGLRIALLGYDEFKPRSFEANATRPGIAWSGEDEQVLRDIAAARDRDHADIVIPFLHWGWEDETTPSPRQREFARRLIDAGAAMVVGSHPHVTQGYELYRGKLIVYSLGNFLFNGFDTEPTLTGWVLSVRLGKDATHDWAIHIAKLDANGVPHPGAEPLPCIAGSTMTRKGRCRPGE